MASMTDTQAATALQLLADAAVERQAELRQYDGAEVVADSDEDNGSDAPIFDTFYEQGGSEGIREMTNFDPQQFLAIWVGFEAFLTANFNTWRGRKSVHTAKDVLFMTLCVLKHGGKWDFLAKMFGLKGPSFERLIMRFIDMSSMSIFEHYVQFHAKKRTLETLAQNKRLFKNYPMARYATDVTFQPSFRPSGSFEEGKRYYSGKHKLYGYKVEVSVLPNGMAIGCSANEPGSVSDLTIFQSVQFFHSKQLRKNDKDDEWEDQGPLTTEFPDSWAVLVDKGYQGAEEFARVIQPKKKPHLGVLTPAKIAVNRNISSDRIIVENYFGRMCTIWNVVGRKWRWAESSYDAVFRLCLGLTNHHIRCNPLRAEDARLFQQIKNRWYKIGTSQIEKRKRVREKYRQKRKRRVELQFRASAFPDRDPESI